MFKSVLRMAAQVSKRPKPSFKKFPGNLPQATIIALLHIGRLPRNSLESSIHLFRNHIGTSLESFPQRISKKLPKKTFKQNKNPLLTLYENMHMKYYMDIANSMKINSENVAEAIKIIFEFCDKGKIGFLSGDLSLELIQILTANILEINVLSIQENYRIYLKIEEYLKKDIFCLPKHGIPYPLKENPQALFKRELLLEKESPEVVSNEDISLHKAFGLNSITPKSNLFKIFTGFSLAVRKEKKRCLKNPQRYMQEYVNTIVKSK